MNSPEATTAAEQVKKFGDAFHRHQTDVWRQASRQWPSTCVLSTLCRLSKKPADKDQCNVTATGFDKCFLTSIVGCLGKDEIIYQIPS